MRVPGDIWALDEYRRFATDQGEMVRAFRDGAMRAVERAAFPHEGVRREDAQSHVARLLDTIDRSHGLLAQRILATGSPTYERAFGKYLAGRKETMTVEEQSALAVAESVERAMGTGGAEGGFAVPYFLDPTLIPSYNLEVVPIRALSRIETITGERWRGVTSSGVTASYDDEATEVSDDSVTLAQPEVFVDKAQAFVPFSIEIAQDWGALQSELARLIQEAKDNLEASAFIKGTGHANKQPEGLLVGATTWLDTAASNTFSVSDVYAIKNKVPVRWRAKGRFLAEASIFDYVRQFDTYGGASMWVQLTAGNPPTLIGYPAYEASTMDSTLVDGASIMVFGDFTQFLIVDRVGLNVEVVPHLFGQNQRPTGQRGIYAHWRNSSQVLIPAAFAVLRVKS
jgi:HK97 family phage major capsid protein